MPTYILAKRVITNANYKTQTEKDEMQFKFDAFLLNNRVTQDEYNELTQILLDKQFVQ
ncbi:protein of unknown function [Acetoanaerobium sticklandii]|uniref:Uncharacterized protein n=1 Tax=Acetoanaerobium sticklandii (strain ATCC 12662 / DSM 519 / JCM 1433 / CCUG 9281 / NCIMB 10654 / HF) TaxID=499177 RepID=E3PRX4_ACESD|nr:hypothetical protein [Acetoanaerobium sticklandii]CBH21628.1 protein of unknown function [Acetoanaerobium sticklandii]